MYGEYCFNNFPFGGMGVNGFSIQLSIGWYMFEI